MVDLRFLKGRTRSRAAWLTDTRMTFFGTKFYIVSKTSLKLKSFKIRPPNGHQIFKNLAPEAIFIDLHKSIKKSRISERFWCLMELQNLVFCEWVVPIFIVFAFMNLMPLKASNRPPKPSQNGRQNLKKSIFTLIKKGSKNTKLIFLILHQNGLLWGGPKEVREPGFEVSGAPGGQHGPRRAPGATQG